MIEVDAISKAYVVDGGRRHLAVRNVTFSASPGEIVCLLGRNGAGKTSTLRMLATVLAPTGGTARIAGYDILEDAPAVRHRVGFHTGDTQLYRRLNGRETLTYFARLYGLSDDEIDTRLALLGQRFGLHLDDPVGKLSTGHRQRLSLARALVHDPPVLILDEPTVGLDLLACRELLDHLLALRDEGRTILLSTHQLAEVESVADRVAVMDEGRLLTTDTVSALKSRGSGDLERAVIGLLTGSGAHA